jgi:dihydroflavonol-4-reductase
MATIGIIGGLDFLGCDLTLKFLSENFRVNVLVLPSAVPGSRLIHTGLVAGENLLIHHFDLENHLQLVKFLVDCDFLLHCGTAYKLPLEPTEGPVYVPLINGTGNLLRAMKKVSSLKKVIFISSVAPAYINEPNLNKIDTTVNDALNMSNNKVISKALFHSKRITNNLLEGFNSTNSGLIVVSPVTIKNNMLLNTANATLAGIRFLLRNHIDHDVIFREIIRRIMFKTMVNVNDLPDIIFDSIQKSEGIQVASRLSKK